MKTLGYVVRVVDYTSEPTITMGWYYQRQDFETGQDEERMTKELKDAFVFEDAGDAQDAARRLLEWFPDASTDVDTEVLSVVDPESLTEDDAHLVDQLIAHCPICDELHPVTEITSFAGCPLCHERFERDPDGLQLLKRINAAIKDLRAIITGETHELDITIKIGTEAYNFYDAPPLVEGMHKALVDWRDDELCR
jgi:hypothetical protein